MRNSLTRQGRITLTRPRSTSSSPEPEAVAGNTQLIFAENCNYGFRRNMLGLRKWGALLAAATGILAAAGVASGLAGLVKIPVDLMAVVLIVSIAATAIWRRVVTPDWVRRVGCSYAERLIEASETLTETS